MPIIPHWFLPTNGDSRSDLSLGNAVGGAGSRVIDANGIEGGAGTGLVGSHQQVADRIAEYHALGIDEFILSGHPHLEEAYQLGEGVLAILRRRGLLAPATPDPEILEV